MRAKPTEPSRRKGGEKMASALQLPREELLRAYRQMRTIREFEDTVHDEFSAGSIPGFVHLYAGEEASGVGVCLHLDDRDVIASTQPWMDGISGRCSQQKNQFETNTMSRAPGGDAR